MKKNYISMFFYRMYAGGDKKASPDGGEALSSHFNGRLFCKLAEPRWVRFSYFPAEEWQVRPAEPVSSAV